MPFAWFNRYMPRSLYARAALILLLPIITIQLVVSVVFIQRLYEDVTEQMTRNVLLDLRFLADEVAAAVSPYGARARIAPYLGPLEVDVILPAEPRTQTDRLFFDLTGREVIATLDDGLERLQAVDLASDDDRVALWLETRHGIMRVGFDRGRVSASNPHQLLVLMVFISLIMTIIAYLFLRNQLRPIRRLAQAAEAFGKGRTVPYRPSGATEVRSAGSAFLDMRHRIERQIEQRTLMLSGVSHDLRTPLTRVKLGLSMLGDGPEVAALHADVADMERLIDAFLAFSRGEALDDAVDCDPAELARAAVALAARAGQNVRLGRIAGAGTARLRPEAVGRALENLIGNAGRYGSQAELSVAISDRAVRFSVEDDGPGIPAADREQALKPFARLDVARNQNRGSGVGLGLSIAIDIARRHGGTLILGESATLGGLKADLVLAR